MNIKLPQVFIVNDADEAFHVKDLIESFRPDPPLEVYAFINNDGVSCACYHEVEKQPSMADMYAMSKGAHWI